MTLFLRLSSFMWHCFFDQAPLYDIDFEIELLYLTLFFDRAPLYDIVFSIKLLYMTLFFRSRSFIWHWFWDWALFYSRLREKAKQTDGSPVALFNMFVQRCKEQLHVVLAMSPIGDAFRNRLRKFPALVNCCTIDWFQVGTKILISMMYYYLHMKL